MSAHSIEAHRLTYVQARGLTRLIEPRTAKAEAVEDEAIELVTATHEEDRGGPREAVMCEVADVVIAAATFARARGWTVEQCIALKTERDRGRDVDNKAWNMRRRQAGARW